MSHLDEKMNSLVRNCIVGGLVVLVAVLEVAALFIFLVLLFRAVMYFV